MKTIILVFLGGGLGSVFRYWISSILNTSFFRIPLGTLTVNILGSFLIGIALSWIIGKEQAYFHSAKLFLAVGFLGGFTTFSSFAFENYSLLKKGDVSFFLIYLFSTVVLGILAVCLGFFIQKWLS